MYRALKVMFSVLWGIQSSVVYANQGEDRYSISSPTLTVSSSISNKREKTKDDWDGSAYIGFNFGLNQSNLTATISSTITSLTDEFADSGFLSFNLSQFWQYETFHATTAVGFSNLAGWGDANGNDETISGLLSVSPIINIADINVMPFDFRLGFAAEIKDITGVDFYAGSNLWLTNNWSVSADLLNDAMNLGSIYRFDRFLGLRSSYISFAIADVLDSRGEKRFILSAGANFSFIN